jgi:hypothetical protein
VRDELQSILKLLEINYKYYDVQMHIFYYQIVVAISDRVKPILLDCPILYQILTYRTRRHDYRIFYKVSSYNYLNLNFAIDTAKLLSTIIKLISVAIEFDIKGMVRNAV